MNCISNQTENSNEPYVVLKLRLKYFDCFSIWDFLISKWNYGNIWDLGFGHIGTNMTPKFVIVSQLSHCAEVLIRSFRNVGSKYPVSGKAKAVDPKWKKFLSLMIINCWQEAPFVKSICNGPEIIHWKFLLCPPVLNMSDTCRHSRIC